MKNYQQKLVSLTNEIETKRMQCDELQLNVNILTNKLLNYEKKLKVIKITYRNRKNKSSSK